MSGEFGNFDAREVEPSVGLASDPVPAGKYKARIVKTEWKHTKKKDGRYCEFVFEVLTGEHQGKRIWARLNLENPSQTAVRIAQGELSAICHATGVMQPKAPQQFHDIPMIIGVKVVPRQDDKTKYTNEIESYESIEAAMASHKQSKKEAPKETAKQTVPDDSGEKAPWD